MSQITFAGSLAHWLEVHSLGRKPKAQLFNREIAATVLKHWPGFLNANPSAITLDQVTEFARRVQHYCPSRFNAMLSALRFITPLAMVIKRRALRCKERVLLTHEQFAGLLVQLDKRPRSHAGLVVRFLAHTGLRINEARALRWGHVERDCIRVPGSVTKNGRGRVIPFIGDLRETLGRLQGLGLERVLPQAECKRSLQRACREAGLPRLSHHDFRHLFATRCIQSGVDLPTVARWLGHSDGGALLARTYFHLVDEHSRKMAARVELTLTVVCAESSA